MLCFNFNEVVDYRTDYNELIFKAIYSLKELYFSEYKLSGIPLFFYHWDEEDFYIGSLSKFSLDFLKNNKEFKIGNIKNKWESRKVVDVKKRKNIRFDTNSYIYNFEGKGNLRKEEIEEFDKYLIKSLYKRLKVENNNPKKLYEALLFIDW